MPLSPVTRRALLATLLAQPEPTHAAPAGAISAIAGVPPSGRITFQALRDGRPLGQHSVTFRAESDGMTVTSAIDYAISLGPFTLFRYRLRGRETWRQGVLEAAEANTDDDGKPCSMRAWREGDDMFVEGSGAARYVAPAGALLASHWNRMEMVAPMVNPQDGTLLRFNPAVAVADSVATLDGNRIPARRYTLAGMEPLELWYDASARWCGLRARARDGSLISYILA